MKVLGFESPPTIIVSKKTTKYIITRLMNLITKHACYTLFPHAHVCVCECVCLRGTIFGKTSKTYVLHRVN
jgi:hypothetical protein